MNPLDRGYSRLITIYKVSSVLVLLYSITLIPPMVVELIYQTGELEPYVITLLTGLIAGSVGMVATRRYKQALRVRDGFIVVVLFWLIYSLMSAMPLVLMRTPDISFVDALFEGVSGITTTGATVFADVDALPRSVVFYRASLNWFGGLGIVVLATAILPALGIGGARLYQSEAAGPFKEERLTPRIADTARILWSTYALLTAIVALCYWLAGMGVLDAVCHSFSTISLGGFSTHTDSLSYFDSNAIEIMVGIFSLIAGLNFTLFYLVYKRRSLAVIYRNEEAKFYLGVFAIVCGIVILTLWQAEHFNPLDAVVHGFVQSASIFTGNGMTVGGYPMWESGVVIVLLLSSFFGGCVGSTSGAIKSMRMLVLFRQSIREVRQLINPRATITLKIGGAVVQDRTLQAVWGFCFLYIMASSFLVAALVFTGLDLQTAFGTVAACINNMGVGDGATAVHFGVLNDTAKWLMCLAMLLGRLEIFPILILFSRAFWRF